MKRYLMTLVAVATTTLGIKAMPYEMAREEAMYLTDKMAYELNLNQRQYEYAYEINLDYLMSLNRPNDAIGRYLDYRNADLYNILYDWQWRIYNSIEYFLHPVCWRHGGWHYPIYNYYAHNYYYYPRPTVYHSYRGGHGRAFYAASFYMDRRPRWTEGFRGSDRGHFRCPEPGRPGFNNRPGNDRPGFNDRPGNGNAGRPGNGFNGRPGNDNMSRPSNGFNGRPGNANAGRPGNGNMSRPGNGTSATSRPRNAGGNRYERPNNNTRDFGRSGNNNVRSSSRVTVGGGTRGSAGSGSVSAGRGHR